MEELVPIAPEDIEADAASGGLYIVRDLLNKMGRIKRELVSRDPIGVKKSMVMLATLLDKKRRDIGNVRAYVTVRDNGDDLKFVVEWTRHAFGFWYRVEVTLRGAVGNLEEANVGKLKTALDPIRWTADGTTRIDSMNRMFKKTKKDRTKDRALRTGLMAG